MEYYIRVFKNYANFKGRDTRKQYWMFALFNFIASLVLSILDKIVFGDLQVLSGIYSLAVLIPSLAISTRRMHDINKSGFWILISLVPIIGVIWYLILCCMPSDVTPNRFGEIEE